jgi:hypothetical protein
MSDNTKNLIEAISAIIQSGVAVVLLGVAIYGVRAWRRQMIGEKGYEAVRRLLVLARRFRANFSRARGIATFSGESEDRPRSANETQKKAEILDEQYARQQRLQPASDILAEIEQAVWEAETITGEEILPLVRPFGEVVRELSIALHIHFSARLQMADLPPGAAVNPAYAKESNKAELLYTREPDELNKRVDDAVEALEQKLRKYIR